MKKILLVSAAIAATALLSANTEASAQTVGFGPYDGSQKITYWGKNKKENYDVAIHLADAGLVGKTIESITIPFDSTVEGVAPKGAVFITKNLALDKKKKNQADVLTDSFDVKPGAVTIAFSKPYTVTTDGVYVGYSLSLTKPANPIPLIAVASPSADNLYIHSNRTYRKWGSRAASIGAEAALEISVSGVTADAVVPEGTGDLNGQTNQPTSYTFNVKNQGSTKVSSVDYTYDIAGETVSHHADFATPIPAHYNSSAAVTSELPVVTAQGTYTLKITIDKVNGVANTNSVNSAEAQASYYNTLPKKRALLEEYTGTWCGYCPRGFVGLESMNKLLGNDFVGVSYHNGDPMEFVASTDYPSAVAGFPDAWIDRERETDAYCGDNYNGHFNIDDVYAEKNKEFAPANLEVKAYFTDASKSKIDAATTVVFPVSNEANKYQLSYILTADGLTGTGSNWDQSNYYDGQGGTYPESDMSTFTNGGSSISGLTFNFVVSGWSGKSYIDGSLPAAVNGDEANAYTYTFDLNNANNVKSSIIQDKEKLHVVALLINTQTGTVANALKVNVYDSEDAATAGIKGVSTYNEDPQNLSRQYYSLDGKRLCQPQRGVNIVRFSNGKTMKVVVK